MFARRAVLFGGAAATSAAAYMSAAFDKSAEHKTLPWADITLSPISRADQIAELRKGGFDLLIIGGGATGTGTALDASTRGLKVALVEAEDFAAGTSSRSTKLAHGGVRYLEKAFFQADFGQLSLVFEALYERLRILQNAPHLSSRLPTLTPCYKLWEVPYYWAGLKAYDLVAYASGSGIGLSRFMPASEASRLFPTLKLERADGTSLKGTVVYYDGQFDDSRLGVALACTSAMAGATVANYTRVEKLLKNPEGKVIGARVKDLLSGEEFDVDAKVCLNCTGIFTDSVRKMSQSGASTMIQPSSGVHVTLPDYYSADATALIVPKTKDGRVVFMVPWLGSTIAGTTDNPSPITMRPVATSEELDFILEALSEYLTVKVRKSDVLSVWSGIRPLASDPTKDGTENLTRDHVVAVEEDGMVTITGGKWTTYRRMAEDAVNTAMSVGGLRAGPCKTTELPVIGAVNWHRAAFTEVAQNYVVPHRPGAIDTRVARHLSYTYGDRAPLITKIAEDGNLGRRLVRGHPMIEAEVVYACHNEYCCKATDFLARRTRLAFLDADAALEALPRVIELMAQAHSWSWWQRQKETREAAEFLKTFKCAL